MRWLARLLLVSVLVAAAAGVWLYRDYQAMLGEPLRVAPNELLRVTPGTGVARLAAELERRGAIRNALYLRLYARLHPQTAALKAGEYAVGPQLTAPELLAKISAGSVLQYSLTVPEGWTFRQLRAAVAEHPQLRQTLTGVDDATVMERLGRAGEHPEGRFFPDTYHFPRDTSDLDFFARAYQAMERELARAWQQRAPDLPLQTPYQALIMASIIERETGRHGERDVISGVFARRLKIGMRLQTDPTVIYGLGEAFDGNLRRRDLTADTPYNTYTRAGLPPTPIALPGRAALRAACHPADGKALYFVAKGDGSHAFAATLAEHNRNVRRYQLKK